MLTKLSPTISRRSAVQPRCLLGLHFPMLDSQRLRSATAAESCYHQTPRPPMHPARAKNVIMLFMEGGPGHGHLRSQTNSPDCIRRNQLAFGQEMVSSFSSVVLQISTGWGQRNGVRWWHLSGRTLPTSSARPRLSSGIAELAAFSHEHRQPAVTQRTMPGRPAPAPEPKPTRICGTTRWHCRKVVPIGAMASWLPTTKVLGCVLKDRHSTWHPKASSRGTSTPRWTSWSSTTCICKALAASEKLQARMESYSRLPYANRVPGMIDLASESLQTQEMYGSMPPRQKNSVTSV